MPNLVVDCAPARSPVEQNFALPIKTYTHDSPCNAEPPPPQPPTHRLQPLAAADPIPISTPRCCPTPVVDCCLERPPVASRHPPPTDRRSPTTPRVSPRTLFVSNSASPPCFPLPPPSRPAAPSTPDYPAVQDDKKTPRHAGPVAPPLATRSNANCSPIPLVSCAARPAPRYILALRPREIPKFKPAHHAVAKNEVDAPHVAHDLNPPSGAPTERPCHAAEQRHVM